MKQITNIRNSPKSRYWVRAQRLGQRTGKDDGCSSPVNSNEGVSPVGKQTPRLSLSAVKFFCFSDTPS